jgi:Holliday junction resolvase-like predicted endonuclease
MSFAGFWHRVLAPLPAHVRTGKWGETIARRHLLRRGFSIIGQNVFVGKRDEIDIVAYDPRDRAIVFVEVKTRSVESSDFEPELNLTQRKRRSISRAARRWVTERGYDGGYRLDLVCVAGGQVTEHYEDVDWA